MSDLVLDLHRAKKEADSLLKLVKRIKLKGDYRQRAWELQIVHELHIIKERIDLVSCYESAHDEGTDGEET